MEISNGTGRGKFIVIEGGDGAGKDTQIDLLKKELGEGVVYTREPGGTPLGKVLREMVLHEPYGALPVLTEAFIFLADRAQHVQEVVAPALAEGKTVISNRSWISMMAYQVYGRERFDMKPFIDEAVRVIYKDCPIDLALILDVSPEVGAARQKAMGKQFDVIESMPIEARARIRHGFLETAKNFPASKVVSADRSIEEVFADIRKHVFEALHI